MRFSVDLLAWLLLGMALLADAETAAADSGSEPPGASLSAAQIDQLTAPVALYPDPLLGAILVAATYPLQVIEAHRWLEDPSHIPLRGAALVAALGDQSWDVSVKSLVPFAQVLQTMDEQLEWTEQLGEAFLDQQTDVMDSIQRLRLRAIAAGSLRSSTEQNVSTLDGDIDIDSASAEATYVPYYDSDTAYGSWPWSDAPPIDFSPPLVAGFVPGNTVLGFGPPVPIVGPLWRWQRWHWHRHQLAIVPMGLPAQPRRSEPPPRRVAAATRAESAHHGAHARR